MVLSVAVSDVTGSILGVVRDLDGGELIAGVGVYIEPELEEYQLDFRERIVITDRFGHYSFTDLPPGEYRVSLDIPSEYLADPEHFYAPPLCATPTVEDLLVRVGETLEVNFDCTLERQTIDVFFLGDDTGSHQQANGIYFGAIQDIIDTLRENPDFNWRFGIGRFEDFGGQSGDENDQPFVLSQAIIPDDDPDFDDLIEAAINATEPGWGG